MFNSVSFLMLLVVSSLNGKIVFILIKYFKSERFSNFRLIALFRRLSSFILVTPTEIQRDFRQLDTGDNRGTDSPEHTGQIWPLPVGNPPKMGDKKI